MVWEEIPENTKIYFLTFSASDWEIVKWAHGHFINGMVPTDDVQNGLDFLNEFLEGRTPNLSYSQREGKPGVNYPLSIPGGYDYLLHSGIIL